MSYEDLAAHQCEWVEPVSADYRGYEVWELPPDGQGIAALQILNILEGFDIAGYGFGSPEHLHPFAKAGKLAFEDRARCYADPDFADIDVDRLISDECAAERRALCDMDRAARSVAPGNLLVKTGDTVYLTTADTDGNIVSRIQSNDRGMGSGMTPPNLGFMLHNRGEMIMLEKGHPNAFEGVK